MRLDARLQMLSLGQVEIKGRRWVKARAHVQSKLVMCRESKKSILDREREFSNSKKSSSRTPRIFSTPKSRESRNKMTFENYL